MLNVQSTFPDEIESATTFPLRAAVKSRRPSEDGLA